MEVSVMEASTQESVDSTEDFNNYSPISVMISDPHMFDCCSCFQSLTIPIFQCINGHIVCSICYNKLQQICLKCSNCLIRCRAFENLLNSIQMFCPNKKYGCKERISFTRDMEHVEECIHVPCYCPLSSCDYVGSSGVLSNHFSHQHEDSRIKFSYGQSFIVSFKSNDKTMVLQEETDRKLYILNNRPVNLGNAVNISCIGPSYSDQHYHCDILARSQICTLKLESSVKNVQRVNLATLSSNFLLIPFEHFGSFDLLNLEICISPKVAVQMQIFLKTFGRQMIPLRVESSDTIGDVKVKILNKLGHRPEEQHMLFAGKRLDDHHTIAYYNIQDNSIINLTNNLHEGQQLRIFIRTTDGNAFPMMAESSDTISDLKTMIFDREKIPVDQQHLIFAGRLLDDFRTISDYNFKGAITIHLVRQPIIS